jgi:septum site-determining protein MinC
MKRMGFYEHRERAETARVLHGLIRSGDVLEEERSIVLFGDVNPGGEIVSAQDVIVLGNLRGSAWAGKGQKENTKAFIYALSFSPLLVRIGPFLARAEDETPSTKPKKGIVPELAFVRQGRIEVIEQSGDVWSWHEPS